MSWHSSGRVHIKTSDQTRHIVEEGLGVVNPQLPNKTRQEIQNTGYQTICLDTIIDVSTLPCHIKKVDRLDIVFDMAIYNGPVRFKFSMVSGLHIIKAERGENTPVHRVDSTIHKERLVGDIARRGLGWESGNADKLLQYALYKYTGDDLKNGRRLFIPATSQISKD